MGEPTNHNFCDFGTCGRVLGSQNQLFLIWRPQGTSSNQENIQPFHFHKSFHLDIWLFETFGKDRRRQFQKIRRMKSQNLGCEINIHRKARNGILVIWYHWMFETLKFWNQDTKTLWNQETKNLWNEETKNQETKNIFKSGSSRYPSTCRLPPLHPTTNST